jgi:predicted component of type VI protein secretion system
MFIERGFRMSAGSRDPRNMTDEEVIYWMQDLVNRLAGKRGSAGGACSLEAVKNPVRRNILKVLEDRALEIGEISERLGITSSALRYHLNFLKNSYFIRIEGDKVDLTPGGVSVIRGNKRT